MEEKRGGFVVNYGVGRASDAKSRGNKGKRFDTFHYIQIRSICMTENTINQIKTELKNSEKMFTT